MTNVRYSGASALLAHLLDGHAVSRLEALVPFGVQSPEGEFGRIKKAGHLLKKQNVPYAKILRRINQYCKLEPPTNLPVREIMMTEYWISR